MPERSKHRGRPRQFDPETALDQAAQIFLKHGYSAASVEALTQAMGINKPSFYAAFGDKHALYLRALEKRALSLGQRYAAAFVPERTLQSALRAFLEEAVSINQGDEESAGCMIASGATTEAGTDPAFRDFTRRFFALSDQVVAAWIRDKRRAAGPLTPDAVAPLVNSVVHDIALRARVGEPVTKLRQLARSAAKVLAAAAEGPSPG